MAIEHDFFGLLETGPDGAIFWSENVDLGDMRVTVDLTAPDELDVTMDGLDAAASMVAGLEEVDSRARNAMLGEVDNRASDVTEFILMMTERYGRSIDDILVDVSGDAPVDIIRSLTLMSMTILPDEHGGSDPFAVLEYALDPDETDDILLVNFGSDGTVQSVTNAD
ncbi:DUF2004 domain-containing protein [Microbacterium amylolyticum]|uniref:DUF2004 domain-containing protein n=1 Tax=Microbacterium amylolyticum TaxID=936337 RepID=A0ABS4ZEK0_9MICO|nr:DUF2004 domain-containing protein [Microbacterium amylolyticum]MBP2435443.1 hypothetical protein [Microbacterium amylolyticum]